MKVRKKPVFDYDLIFYVFICAFDKIRRKLLIKLSSVKRSIKYFLNCNLTKIIFCQFKILVHIHTIKFSALPVC